MTLQKRYIVLFFICVFCFALFLAVSYLVGGKLGFPLDDAWIHQTYARSLARNGRFEYIPGVTSAGSTAPLWTILLAIGYLIRVPYHFWAYFLGLFALLWLVWGGMAVWRSLWPSLAEKDWIAGLGITFTWPLLWAATSGMETLLFAALGMQIAALYLKIIRDALFYTKYLVSLGFLSGLLILIRPDGAVLLALMGLGLLLPKAELLDRIKRAFIFGVVAVATMMPYFFFNYWTSGTIWPNTMYAKQTEYAIVLEQFIGFRIPRLLYYSLGGSPDGLQGISAAHLLLLPGIIFAAWQAVKYDWEGRQLAMTVPLLWAFGHVVLYAWRLPVTFQHGRYLMSAMPVWVLYGLAGWLFILFDRQSESKALWFAQRIAGLTLILITLFFLLQGAVAYAQDVAIVEGEMVAVAQWLAENTSEDALIASHDIGAIGYFAERPLLDLAGLISPEIIPLLADETALEEYVLFSDANYLVTAPGWPYTAVANDKSTQLVYSTDFPLTQEAGLNNMTVYILQRPLP